MLRCARCGKFYEGDHSCADYAMTATSSLERAGVAPRKARAEAPRVAPDVGLGSAVPFDRVAYMRRYMRKYRAAKRARLPIAG